MSLTAAPILYATPDYEDRSGRDGCGLPKVALPGKLLDQVLALQAEVSVAGMVDELSLRMVAMDWSLAKGILVVCRQKASSRDAQCRRVSCPEFKTTSLMTAASVCGTMSTCPDGVGG